MVIFWRCPQCLRMAAVDRLVKALEANKALLPPIAKKEEAAN
jgi:hypothetical protein